MHFKKKEKIIMSARTIQEIKCGTWIDPKLRFQVAKYPSYIEINLKLKLGPLFEANQVKDSIG